MSNFHQKRLPPIHQKIGDTQINKLLEEIMQLQSSMLRMYIRQKTAEYLSESCKSIHLRAAGEIAELSSWEPNNFKLKHNMCEQPDNAS